MFTFATFHISRAATHVGRLLDKLEQTSTACLSGRWRFDYSVRSPVFCRRKWCARYLIHFRVRNGALGVSVPRARWLRPRERWMSTLQEFNRGGLLNFLFREQSGNVGILLCFRLFFLPPVCLTFGECMKCIHLSLFLP